MANKDTPYGLWPLDANAAPSHPYTIAASYATAVYPGELVAITTDGSLIITAAGSGNQSIGVVQSVETISSSTGEILWYHPAANAKVATVMVYDDPDTEFVCQAAGSVVQADIGATAPVIRTHTTAAAVFKRAACEVSTPGTSNDQFTILGKVDAPDNAWGTNVDLRVMIAAHQRGHAVNVDQ